VKKNLIIAAIGVFLAMLVAGCAVPLNEVKPAGPGGAGGAGSPAGSWALTSWSDASAVPNDPNSITLVIADGRVSGKSACNQYMGPVTIDGNGFTVGDLASTMMACLDDTLASAESTYLHLLAEVDGWSVDGGELVLSSGGTETLRYKAA